MIQLTTVRAHLLAYPGAREDTPFGPDVLVYRVGSKMFALLAWQQSPMRLNLKCDPEQALLLRALHPEVTPGWHMNKRHWNSIALTDELDSTLWQAWVDHSYQLICAALPKKERPNADPASHHP